MASREMLRRRIPAADRYEGRGRVRVQGAWIGVTAVLALIAWGGWAHGTPGPRPSDEGAPRSAAAEAISATGPVSEAEARLRALDFGGALGLLEGLEAEAGGDYGAYLRAVALKELGRDKEAVEAARELRERFPGSPWEAKAWFLEADVYVKGRAYARAEAIYAAQAKQLLSRERKERVARLYIAYAEDVSKEADPNDLGAPKPDYGKAFSLYEKALEIESSPELADLIQYRMGVMQEKGGRWKEAAEQYGRYLRRFDSLWRRQREGPGAGEREQVEREGAHRAEARLGLCRSLSAAGDPAGARSEIQNLEAAAGEFEKEPGHPEDLPAVAREAAWLLPRTFQMPTPADDQSLERGVKAVEEFLGAYPDDARAVSLAYQVPQAYLARGRAPEAAESLRGFLEQRGFSLPEEDIAPERLRELELSESPAETWERLRKEATARLGDIAFQQRRYEEAVGIYERYIAQFPEGPDWSRCQEGILDARFRTGTDLAAAKRYDEAREQWERFLAEYPLDGRSRQILFAFGQMYFVEAEKAKEETPEATAEARALYAKAIAEWSRLVSKYPETEESSLAQLRIGGAYERELGDLEKALDAYRKLTWGPHAEEARERVRRMTEKELVLATERVFRTDEAAAVRLDARNIEKVTVEVYRLDLEAYFRKYHSIQRVEDLDIGLIAATERWEVPVEGYERYRPITQRIEIPFDGAGVYAVRVGEEDYEATTLVIRSDLDAILKTSRRQALVYVENRREGKPEAGARVLFSIAGKVVAEATTGEDGVALRKLEELKDADGVSVFAASDRGIASNLASLAGLGFSRGLAAKGYIYTDRTAYRPGEEVHIRGIIRGLAEGSYAVEAGGRYLVTVTDAQGRMIHSEEVSLSGYGTFTSSLLIPSEGSVGEYTILVTPAEESDTTFRGGFQVQRFQLEKVLLTATASQPVAFRGDIVSVTFAAQYSYGQPLAERSIRYTLPDGRSFVEKTDAEGRLAITFDTTPMGAGRMLWFEGRLEEENVTARAGVMLAEFEYALAVEASRAVALAGEPVEVTVRTTGADGKPVAKEVAVTALRREVSRPDPVLSGVPWMSDPGAGTWSDVEIETKRVTTDADGVGRVTFTIEQGGEITFRAQGKDRFGNTVTGSAAMVVSAEDEATRLRILSDRQHLKVGEEIEVVIHSRLAPGLCLITFEGEEILDYRVEAVAEGKNALAVRVGHEHFPNFRLAAAGMRENRFYTAAQDYTVERELHVEIAPSEEVYVPGATAEVTVAVTDSLGRPVEAEVSLALVEQALLALFPDPLEPIVDFFQKDARREAALRTETTCTFAYHPPTQKVRKEILAEEMRLAEEAGAEGRLRTPIPLFEVDNRPLREALQLLSRMSGLHFVTTGGVGEVPVTARLSHMTVKSILDTLLKEYGLGHTVRPGEDFVTITTRQEYAARAEGEGVRSLGVPADFEYTSLKPDEAPTPASAAKAARSRERFIDRADALERGVKAFDANGLLFFAGGETADFGGLGEFIGGAYAAAAARPRREVPSAGLWVGSIETDKDGRATVTVAMPEKTTAYRFLSRGCSVETLVGEGGKDTIVRTDFFADFKIPRILVEGDKVRAVVRVHNLTDYEGKAALKLSFDPGENSNGEKATLPAEIEVRPGKTTEHVFQAYEVPAADSLEARLTVSAGEGRSDSVVRSIPVRPWGLEYADYAGGSSEIDETAFLQLPAATYTSRWMTILVGPSAVRDVVDMALLEQPFCSWERGLGAGGRDVTASELLGVAGAVDYVRRGARGLESDLPRLRARGQGLIATLVASQRDDGGWAWVGAGTESDPGTSARCFWALAAAKRAGLPVDADLLGKASGYLIRAFQRADQNDNLLKAAIQCALSYYDAADFAFANRLYRERNTLPPSAQAYTVLTLANLNRKEMGGEVLDLLLSRAQVTETPQGRLRSWVSAAPRPPYPDPGEVERAALTLLALEAVRPESPEVRELADTLLSHRGAGGWMPRHSSGLALLALARYYGEAQFVESDYGLTVSVNDREVATLAVDGRSVSRAIQVPPEVLREGENRVEFDIEGRGSFTYAITLTGFSPELKDPESFPEPRFGEQTYYHATLEYKGRPIAASSQRITQLESGKVSRVFIHVAHGCAWSERQRVIQEHLPAGCTIVEESLQGNWDHYELGDGVVAFYYQRKCIDNISYQLVGYAPGEYRVLPPVIREALDPSRMRLGTERSLAVLAPGEQSTDPYAMNSGELFGFGEAYFNDGEYAKALEHLNQLWGKDRNHREREQARMQLWIHTHPDFYDARRVVEAFEILRERYPELSIPFEKTLVVGAAYRDMEEYERAYLVFRAAIHGSFEIDSRVAGVLDQQGEFLGSVHYLRNLWLEYPDSAAVTSALFALSQTVYAKAPEAQNLRLRRILGNAPRWAKDKDIPTRQDVIRQAAELLQAFLTLHSRNPLADDAGFSLTNALMELRAYAEAAATARSLRERYPESAYVPSFQYLEAVGEFHLRRFDEAAATASLVADSTSEDRFLATYILGQIHHARRSIPEALEYYRKVEEQFPDAKEAADYFERKAISLDEVTSVTPGQPAEVAITYRNIPEAHLQVYRVDLMKLYLMEQNLDRVADIRLAGVDPTLVREMALGGRRFEENRATEVLDLEGEGAYLVLARGEDLFASGMLLMTSLAMEVQEDAASGRVRVNVYDASTGEYRHRVHVKVVGSKDGQFRSGETDMRGIFIADGVVGIPTVIARDEANRYAFYRGKTWLGPREEAPAEKKPAVQEVDYFANLSTSNTMLQQANIDQMQKLMTNVRGGVQVYEMY